MKAPDAHYQENSLLKKRYAKGMLAAVSNLFVAFGCIYLISRSIFLMWADYDSASMVLGILLLMSEAFVMFHSISFAIDFASSLRKKTPRRKEVVDWRSAPSVAVLMPARHEPRSVLENTLICLENLDYPNKKIYFLDDSSEAKYKQEAEDLAKSHGAELFRREERHGAKAGILNDCIRELKEKYIAVFDADQNPISGFLKQVIPLLEGNERLAFVQAPQFYTNIDSSAVAFSANLQHCMFYEYICEGKSKRGAMICCGTNVVLRREALLDVGGFDEKSITEDFSTSIDFHTRGWESIYYGHVYVFGTGPESLLPYLKQQWRWSRGNIGVLKKILRYFFTHPWALNAAQWWEYFATGSYYLIGWAYFFLMLCPIAYIFFNVPTFFIEPEMYFLTFIPYFSLSITIFYVSMSRRRYRTWHLFRSIQLGFLALPVYMRAALAALFNTKATFGITQKAGAYAATPYRHFWPQISLLLLNFVAIIWGINRMLLEIDFSILMSLVWVSYHFLLLSGIFYLRNPVQLLLSINEKTVQKGT